MRIQSVIGVAGLMFLATGTSAAASPLEEIYVPEDSVVARSYDQLQKQAGYQNGTIEVVAQLVSELVAVQAVGAATSQSELDYLLVQQIICAGSKPPTLTFLPLIRNLTSLVSSEIWTVQAIGAVQGNVRKLCEIIDAKAASAIGLIGDQVKKDVCAAADIAGKVAQNGGTTPVTLTVPQVATIAPLSELTLPFVRVTPTPTVTRKP